MNPNTNDDFFGNAPQGYEVPKTEGRYMNFKEPGTYKFRILQKPIFGWEAWKIVEGKNKPYRFRMNEKPADLSSFKEAKADHFWAMPVWNFKTKRVEVLSFTQKSIQATIEGYARNEEWGSPLGYNLTVTREGTGRDNTKYSTIASPHSPITEDIAAAWKDVQEFGFNIAELYTDGDPFKPTHPAPAEPKAAQTAPAVEPELVEPLAVDPSEPVYEEDTAQPND